MKFTLLFFLGCFVIGSVSAQNPGNIGADPVVWLKADSLWTAGTWKNIAPSDSRVFTSLSSGGSGTASQYGTPAEFNFNRAILLSDKYYSTGHNHAINDFFSTSNAENGRATFFAVSNSPHFDLTISLYTDETSAPCGTNRCNSGYRFKRLEFANAALQVSYRNVGTNQLSIGQRIDNTSSGLKAFANGVEFSGSGSRWNVSSGMHYTFSVGEFPGSVISRAVPEIIWYKNALTDGALQRVQTYLAFKYGITLIADTIKATSKSYIASDNSTIWDSASAGSYRHNIFGIGRDDNSARLHQKISHSVNNTGNTTTAGQHLIVATNNNFTALNTNANRPDIPNNLQFLTFSDNGGVFNTFDVTITGGPEGNAVNRSRRVWRAQDKGGIGTSYYQFSGLPTGGSEQYYVLTADDSTLTTARNFTEIQVSSGGSAVAPLNLKDNTATYFTIVRTIELLPVSLLYFKAKAAGGQVQLSWATALEANNRGFWIEKSSNGNAFEALAFVSSKAANGNSQTPQNYSFVDDAPFAGKNYYRLKQVDFNGASEYSPVSVVAMQQSGKIVIYPNPAKNIVWVKGLSGNETIRITDAAGRLVKQLTASGAMEEISLTDMSKGTYTLTIVAANGAVVVKKLVKM